MVFAVIRSLLACMVGPAIVFVGCGGEQLRRSTVRPAIRMLSVGIAGSLWVLTEDGRVLISTDRGKSWRTSGEGIMGRVEALALFGTERAWAVNAGYRVWYTEDAGHNWVVRGQLSPGASEPPLIRQVLFSDDTTGWILDPFSVWFTDDGGFR